MSGRRGYLGNSGAAVTKNHRAYPLRVGSELAGLNCRQSAIKRHPPCNFERPERCRVRSFDGDALLCSGLLPRATANEWLCAVDLLIGHVNAPPFETDEEFVIELRRMAELVNHF